MIVITSLRSSYVNWNVNNICFSSHVAIHVPTSMKVRPPSVVKPVCYLWLTLSRSIAYLTELRTTPNSVPKICSKNWVLL